jgi:hypothetical protein
VADSNPIIVGAGISGTGNTGELAYFNSNATITGTPGILVTNIAGGSKLGFGGTPGTAGALNVDCASYGNLGLILTSGSSTEVARIGVNNGTTFVVRAAAGATMFMGANALTKWTILSEAAGTCTLQAAENTARIVSGASSFAVRESTNARDVFSINAAASAYAFTRADGSRGFQLFLGGIGGEIGNGCALETSTASDVVALVAVSGGGAVKIGYFDSVLAASRSALEVAPAAGLGTLDLMKSGGVVRIGTGPGNTANCLTVDGSAFGAGVASVRLNGLTNGAGASAGTLTNAPAVGNPTFWIPINIAGVVKYVPSW